MMSLKSISAKLKTHLITVAAMLIALSFSTSAAKLYKWVDENGEVYYSDKIPPKANKGAHSLLNEKGIAVESKGPAKTKEEIEKQRELERLRKEKELVIKKQEAKDKVLLKSFRSEDDLILARDGKIRSVDNYINITKGNIKRFKTKLAIMQSQAAELEKAGKTVNKKFLGDMEAIKRQINQSYASIVARQQSKVDIRDAYQADIDRFRVLKKLTATDEETEISKKVAELNTVFLCIDVIQCNNAWEKAIDYVKNHASTKLQLIGDNIYMTSAPNTDTEISLTVARIKDKNTNEEKIFLDQQCRSSFKGQNFCNSETSLAIKRQFLPTLAKELTQ